MKDQAVLIVLNPMAGRRRARKATVMAAYLRRAGRRCSIVRTNYAGEAIDLTREAVSSGAFSGVVAAGGDGTVAEVAEGFAAAFREGASVSTVFAVLPLGTANVFAKELRLPFSPRRNAQLLLSGKSRQIWPGVLSFGQKRRVFVQMTGIGFDAQCVHDVSRALKKKIGALAYIVAAARAWQQFRFNAVSVICDGVAYDATSVIVSKGRFYGGRFQLASDLSLTEKRFSVLLLQGGRFALVKTSIGLLLGRPTLGGGAIEVAAQKIEIRREGLAIQSDGDARDHTPCRLSLADHPFHVACD